MLSLISYLQLEGNALKGEEVLAAALKGAASALGKTNKAVVRHFGSAGRRAVVVEEKDPEAWEDLISAARADAGKKEEQAQELDAMPAAAPGVVESTRAKAVREGKAGQLRVASALLFSAAEDLDDAIINVRAARNALRTEKEATFGALEETSKKKGGVVTKAYTDAMARHNINPQKYWNGTLVGPDCRRYLEHYEDILLLVKAAIIENEGAGIGEPKATAFYNRHCAVLKHLAIVTHYSRKNELLTPGEISELREACKACPAAIFRCLPRAQVPDRQSRPHRAALDVFH